MTEPVLPADTVRGMTHAQKLQLLRDLLEESKAAHERTKATLAWFTAWRADHSDGTECAS